MNQENNMIVKIPVMVPYEWIHYATKFELYERLAKCIGGNVWPWEILDYEIITKCENGFRLCEVEVNNRFFLAVTLDPFDIIN